MRFKSILLALLCFILTACGLSDRAEKAADKAKTEYDTVLPYVEKKMAEFEAKKKDEYFKAKYAKYIEPDRWDVRMNASLAAAKKLKSEWDSLYLVVDKNDSDDSDNVIALSSALVEKSKAVKAAANIVDERMAFLDQTEANQREWFKQARANFKEADKLASEMTALRDTYAEKYKNPKIPGKLTEALKPHEDVKKGLAVVEEESAKEHPNFLHFGDAVVLSNEGINALRQERDGLKETYGELDTSYTTILSDMRIDYYITVGVSAWDEWDDYDSSHEHAYSPVKITEEQYLYYSSKDGISAGDVSKLGLDPRGFYRPGDDSAEFWVQDWEMLFWHKYIEVNEKGAQESKWEEVDQPEFEAYMNALGMSIYSKPFGLFEEEGVYQAHPPGLAFVGNDQYGEYRRDPSSGEMFWHFYNSYVIFNSLMSPGYHYTTLMYDDWYHRRNTAHYYGRDASRPAFGSRSRLVQTNTRMAASSWTKSGKAATPPRTVRASSARTGGGPGGGGK